MKFYQLYDKLKENNKQAVVYTTNFYKTFIRLEDYYVRIEDL